MITNEAQVYVYDDTVQTTSMWLHTITHKATWHKTFNATDLHIFTLHLSLSTQFRSSFIMHCFVNFLLKFLTKLSLRRCVIIATNNISIFPHLQTKVISYIFEGNTLYFWVKISVIFFPFLISNPVQTVNSQKK